MKIIFISDTHGHKIDIPNGDVLVHCGDITMNGTKTELKLFKDWFCNLPHSHKVLVPGNHDFIFEDALKYAKHELNGVNVLVNEEIIIDGIKFYGTPDQPTFYNWAFNRTSKQMEDSFADIPYDTDVLVTHTPPYAILDEVARGGFSVGSAELLEVVKKISPIVHAFGHIHESYGITEVNGVDFINCSIYTVKYRPTNKPVVYEIRGL
jgi:Icc-related predicted phosphoesterase